MLCPWTVSARDSPVSFIHSSAPWGTPGTLSGVLSKRWLEEGESHPRFLEGHLMPRHVA